MYLTAHLVSFLQIYFTTMSLQKIWTFMHTFLKILFFFPKLLSIPPLNGLLSSIEEASFPPTHFFYSLFLLFKMHCVFSEVYNIMHSHHSTSIATHLCLIKSHVVAHDVELHNPRASVTFDPVCIERQWVAQLVAQR